ncbi:ribosome biogenesis GTPase YqeH [Bacillus fonticola]|uniref:ribosome biogenesis GTPase YqeH n=1 Tax=Bacillus fonticola TaxID=2728853 RepID=UPI001D13C282|nr:ribosome biogenesis GTPase YqeH [Bacillus fonticola]
MITCSGCGIDIQTEQQDKIGFAPKQALTRDIPYCQRCFRLRHYHETPSVSLTDSDYLELLHEIGSRKGLFAKVVDIFDFHGSFLPGLQRMIGSNPCVLIANKVDLLPKSASHERLIHWMKYEAKQLGLTVQDVLLVSAQKGTGVQEAMQRLDALREGEDLYIVGCTNVGKSTFINKVLEEAMGEKELITTSQIPGTTLGLIEIGLEDGQALYDTPGIVNADQMAHVLTADELKAITPKKEIKPKVYQLDEGQTLFLGGLARLDFLSGDHASFVVYVANDLYIHRTKTERADTLYEEHVGEMLTPPTKDRSAAFPSLTAQELSSKNEECDIVFSGLGWVRIPPGVRVRAYVPKGVTCLVRKAIL